MENYYQQLVLSQTATPIEIKQAIQQQIQQVKQAYQTLSNPEKRQQYDQTASQSQANNHYVLLGVDVDATDSQIKVGGQSKLDHLKTMYHVLLDSGQRADYDAALQEPPTQTIDDTNDWGMNTAETKTDLPAQAHAASTHDSNPYAMDDNGTDDNPYETPVSDVSTHHGDKVAYKLLSTARVGRIRYIAYSFQIAVVVNGFSYLIGLMLEGAASGGDVSTVGLWISSVLLIVLGLGSMVLNILLFIQRLHDFNYSAWWLLSFFLVIPAFFFFLMFLFKAGTPEENNYGLPCVDNTRGEKIIAGFAIALYTIAFIGVITAIAMGIGSAFI